MLNAIDSIFVAVADLDDCRPYERLGLKLSPAQDGRTLHVGSFAVHFLADAKPPLAQPLHLALSAGRPLFAVGLGVADLGILQAKGLAAPRSNEMAWLPLHERAGTDLVLVRSRQEQGLPAHGFPLKRLDHLAIVTHDLELKTRFWADVLGVLVAGEVTTATMVIRQLRLGDAVLELLGPASPDSPLWQRKPGLVGMASWEVDDLAEAVRLARVAGFTVTDPAPGPLPNTLIATIQGGELAGVNMQLLQYH